jgi:hypothetical protein
MVKTLSTFKLRDETSDVSDLYHLIDQLFIELDKSQEYDTFKSLCSAYTGAVVLHESNYQIILSDLLRLLDDELNKKMSTKLRNTNLYGAISHVTNLISPLNTYNSMPTIGNFISILERLEVETNTIRRFKFISSLSKDIPRPPHLTTLELVYTQQQVILLVSYNVLVLIFI